MTDDVKLVLVESQAIKKSSMFQENMLLQCHTSSFIKAFLGRCLNAEITSLWHANQNMVVAVSYPCKSLSFYNFFYNFYLHIQVGLVYELKVPKSLKQFEKVKP